MEQNYKIPEGVRIEVSKNGFVVVSKTGECTEFDNAGNCIFPHVKEAPTWLKYFDTIGKEEREIVASWYCDQKGKTKAQKSFLSVIGKALQVITDDYRIANIEPSLDKQGKLYYKEYNSVCVGLTCAKWVELSKEFAPEYKSELASLERLFLWYAYRIATEKWTLEYVCDNSSMCGNYWHAPNSSKELEPSALRPVGGARDGVGNTCKIVRKGNGFALCGGYYEFAGIYYPVADVKYYKNPESFCDYGSGAVVLRKF